MRLSELDPDRKRALTLQVKRMTKQYHASEAAKLRAYWNPEFLLRLLLWCEIELAERPEIAMPYCLEAPQFVKNWRRSEKPDIRSWPRFLARSYALKGSALCVSGKYQEAHVAYRMGQHVLTERRQYIRDSDVCDFYQMLSRLYCEEHCFELAQADLDHAFRIAQQAKSKDDIGKCHVYLGCLYSHAAEEQTEPRLKGMPAANRYEAAVHFNEALQFLDGRKDASFVGAALMNLFYLAAARSERAGRRDILQQMDATQEKFKSRKQRATKTSTKFNWARAVIYGSVGDHEIARDLLQDCLKKFRSFKMKDHCIAVLLDLAHIEETTGNRDALAAIAEQATPLIEEHAKNGGPETHRLRTWLDACTNKLEPEPATMHELRAALSPFASLPAANEAQAAIESA